MLHLAVALRLLAIVAVPSLLLPAGWAFAPPPPKRARLFSPSFLSPGCLGGTLSAAAAAAGTEQENVEAAMTTETSPPPLFPERLNIIYDSKCSVCRWEVDFLRARMNDLAGGSSSSFPSPSSSSERIDGGEPQQPSLPPPQPPLFRFTDLESSLGYVPSDPANAGVTYEDGMRTFTAVKPDGTVLRGVDVFREAYDIADMGWVFALTRSPMLGGAADAAYKLFARYRTDVTRGANVEELIRRYYDGKDDECIPCKEKRVASIED